MRKLLFIFLLVFFIVSCEKELSDTESKNVENMEWFKEIKTPCDETTVCKLRINKGLYEGDTVFFTSLVGALCDMYFSVSIVNINGDTLKSYSGPDNLEDFNNEVQFVETIYRCENN